MLLSSLLLSNMGPSGLPEENLQAVHIKGRILQSLHTATNDLRAKLKKNRPGVLLCATPDFKGIYWKILFTITILLFLPHFAFRVEVPELQSHCCVTSHTA